MSTTGMFDTLRKEIAGHRGVLGMLVPPDMYSKLCKVYLEGGRRPSTEEMRSDTRYLISIGAEL